MFTSVLDDPVGLSRTEVKRGVDGPKADELAGNRRQPRCLTESPEFLKTRPRGLARDRRKRTNQVAPVGPFRLVDLEVRQRLFDDCADLRIRRLDVDVEAELNDGAHIPEAINRPGANRMVPGFGERDG